MGASVAARQRAVGLKGYRERRYLQDIRRLFHRFSSSQKFDNFSLTGSEYLVAGRLVTMYKAQDWSTANLSAAFTSQESSLQGHRRSQQTREEVTALHCGEEL